MLEPLVLVIPAGPDPERDQVADVWSASNGEIVRIDRFWEPPALDRTKVRLYGNDTFCLVLAQILELTLVSPANDLLVNIEGRWLGRNIDVVMLANAEGVAFPKFIKPVVPKQFRAAVYADLSTLLAETEGLESEAQLMVSDVVDFEAEVRCFILNGRVRTAACYEGQADVRDATAFADGLAATVPLPATVVLDVGHTDAGWLLIEANATWGSGLNSCDPIGAAECIRAATKPH
jgi:ATP-grasp domain-containing protein